jgi:phosphatidylserine/phosphatidylglycerophosphate/cardiolipin synthase-like enzyme
MALSSLSELDQFKATAFAPGYPDATRTFYSPVDRVHEVLKTLLASATRSLVVSMYGYDDEELDDAIRRKLDSEKVFVQMSLDKSQASGIHERAILANWKHEGIGNSIAIGHSEHHAIMHLKMVIIDGLDVVTGSTNWSTSGESDQDNQLTVVRNPLVASEARARIDIIHDNMLKQMSSLLRQGQEPPDLPTPRKTPHR